MELPAFDPVDFKKFTDGKTIVKVSKNSTQHEPFRVIYKKLETNLVHLLMNVGH